MSELEQLAQLMRDQDLDAVFAEYGGAGDSGAVNNVSIYREGKPPENAADEVLGVVYDAVYALLEKEHPGWEINDGADGSIEFWRNKENGGVTAGWTHRQFYLASKDTEHEFEI